MTMGIDDLLAEREIHRKMVAFARAMDDRAWGAFAEFTLEDMTADLGQGELSGRDTIVAFIRSFLDDCGPTQHLLGNILVDVKDDTAHSTADVCDMHIGLGAKSHLTFRTLGRYHDEWRQVDGTWLMVRRVKKNPGYVGSLEIFSR